MEELWRFRPWLKEEELSRKESHLPNRVKLSERLYEKKVDLFARANSARACSADAGRIKGYIPAHSDCLKQHQRML